MNIVMLEPLGIKEEKVMQLADSFINEGHTFSICTKKIESEDELINRASNADVLIIANSPLSGKVIRAAKNLKMISVAFTGIDHVDKDACKERNILVCNAQGYCTNAVAEMTFGLILSTLRNIVPCHDRTKSGKTKDGLVGNELYNKTIGIVGTGAIGRKVGEIGKAFGCKLLGYSRTEYEEAKNIGIQYVDLNTLFKESDIITLHVPLTEETKLMVNEEKIKSMKKSAIIINVARGAVVDSNALAKALNDGSIAGAGIDVFETEPPIEIAHPLLQAKNIVLAPHVAFATEESILRRAQITFDNIGAWMKGTPENVKLK